MFYPDSLVSTIKEERKAVWRSIIELSGYGERNSLLLHHARTKSLSHRDHCVLDHTRALNDCLVGVRCLWRFNLLDTWAADMQEDHVKLYFYDLTSKTSFLPLDEIKKKFAEDLYDIAW